MSDPLNITERISLLATSLGTDIKSLRAAVAAVPALASLIDDLASSLTTDKTYSASKITALIQAAVAQAKAEATDDALSAIRDGVPAALDTLNELANRLADDGDALAELITLVSTGTVRTDIAQNLSAAQKLQAQTNLGLLDVDFNAVYIAARDAA